MTDLQLFVRTTDEVSRLAQDAKNDLDTLVQGIYGQGCTTLEISRAQADFSRLAELVEYKLAPMMETAARVIVKVTKQRDDALEERDEALVRAEQAFQDGADYALNATDDDPDDDEDDDDDLDDEGEAEIAEEKIMELEEELASARANLQQAVEVNETWHQWAVEHGVLEA
jgi:type IV secretory pathway VirJ component